MDPGRPVNVFGLSIIALEVVVAIFTLIFIISVIFRDFHRNKKLDTKDEIQLALKVSSVIFMTVLPYNEFSSILQPDLYKMSHLSPVFVVAIVYCMCSCSMLIALQSFFYFIKIVHFQRFFIPWLKLRIDSIVPWQIVVVEVVSLCISLSQLLPYRATHVSFTNSSYISSANRTPQQMIEQDYISYLILIIVHALLLLSMTATFITAAFLWCHMKKMKDTNTSGEVHQYIHAVKKILCFILLYFVFYVVMILYYFSVLVLYSIGYWINLILVFSFIPAVNVLQIIGTPHLRTTWKEMTHYFILCREPNTHCCLSQDI